LAGGQEIGTADKIYIYIRVSAICTGEEAKPLWVMETETEE
jgi:hypothetical protein